MNAIRALLRRVRLTFRLADIRIHLDDPREFAAHGVLRQQEQVTLDEIAKLRRDWWFC